MERLMARSFDRRSFLRAAAGMSVASVLTPELVLADPYVPWRPKAGRSAPIRVRGRVSSGGRGLAGVRVSDGASVVRTDRDGAYELLTEASRDFVTCSVPSGYDVARNPSGTARFYHPLSGASDELDASFDLAALDGSDRDHVMLWLPDVQTQDAWEMDCFHEQSVPDVLATVRALGDRHVFGIAGGDIMFDDLSMYPDYERGVERMGIPFFQAVGNHDLDFDGVVDEATTRTFSSRFGPRYYSFDRGAVRYVVLDDVFYHGTGYIGYLQLEQLRWLEADLADLEPGAPLIVAAHIPVRGTRHEREGAERPGVGASINNRELLYRLLEPFDAHVVSGHTHENDHNWRGGVHEHVSGTVCGAWWSGPICGDGTPNGYAVYDVRGAQVSWRYKSTGRPDDHQMRVYAPGADPRAPQELVANVWDADDDWEVVWYENGERRGRMSRRVGIDPVSREIHSGEDLPPRRPWVDPYPRYLYYAPVGEAGDGVLTVEATDRFGRRYTADAGPIPADLRAWERS